MADMNEEVDWAFKRQGGGLSANCTTRRHLPPKEIAGAGAGREHCSAVEGESESEQPQHLSQYVGRVGAWVRGCVGVWVCVCVCVYVCTCVRVYVCILVVVVSEWVGFCIAITCTRGHKAQGHVMPHEAARSRTKRHLPPPIPIDDLLHLDQ